VEAGHSNEIVLSLVKQEEQTIKVHKARQFGSQVLEKRWQGTLRDDRGDDLDQGSSSLIGLGLADG
jgi:hypothetical protein